MTFETNGQQIRTKLTVSPQFRGWSKLIHGGVISTILDETMSWAAIILTKRFILTKQMTVQFLRPVYVGSSLCGIGSIKEQNDDRNATVQAELFDDQGKLCARSEGEFVLFSKEQFARYSSGGRSYGDGDHVRLSKLQFQNKRNNNDIYSIGSNFFQKAR